MSVKLSRSHNARVLHYRGRISIEVYELNAVAMQSRRFSLQPLSAATSAPGISTDRLRKACLNQQFSVIIPLLSCLTPCEGVTQASLCLLDGFGQIFSHALWSGDMTASCWTENKGHNSTQGSRKFTGKELKPWTHHFETQSGCINCLKGEKMALFASEKRVLCLDILISLLWMV